MSTVPVPKSAEVLLERRAPIIAGVLLHLARAIHRGEDTAGAVMALAERLWRTMALTDLLARVRILRRADRVASTLGEPAPGEEREGESAPSWRPATPSSPGDLSPSGGGARRPPGGGGPPAAAAPSGGGGGDFSTDLIPRVSYREAMDNLTLREPRLLRSVPGGGSLDERMGRLYRDGGFSLARATERETVQRVQRALRDALDRGVDKLETEALIAEMGPWSRSYANLVYRNNVNTVYTAGTLAQMQDPDVADLLPAVRFDALMDGDTTAICRALHGTLAPPSHPIWDSRSTPAHHGCRSGLTEMDRPTLKRMGLYRNGAVVIRIPNPGARAAPGFGQRRDLPLTGPVA